MPFPRHVIIYLREKGIPQSLVAVVHVSDPQLGNVAPPEYPFRPKGSLPILAIPETELSGSVSYTYIRQSLAIMNYLDELCDAGHNDFPLSRYSMRGADALSRARITEVVALADECTTSWNLVRTFGSGAGTMSIPAASKEMMKRVRRPLNTIEGWWSDRDMSSLRQNGSGEVTMGDIVLYQFLEFTKDCYGVDMTQGSGEPVKDAYGRDVVEKYTKLGEFYDAFRTRESARRDEAAGEVASKEVLQRMMMWAPGSL
ncbi:hypothetical protein LTR66_008412 [Elasticomyces elasticus]|nr:hypothetical protein LTR28_006824 [Elasticomyces elasticus]KAK4984680.1 hypothetical protein LTR66_008412 [Elasticomyces elasticus]